MSRWNPPRRPTRLTAGQLAFVALFGLALLAGLIASIVEDYEPIKLSALFFLLFWMPLVAVHEAGHAIAARLVGWRVCHLVVGFGPRVAAFRALGAQIELRLAPIEGFVIPAPTSLDGVRWKNALVYFGGPGVEIAILALLVAVVGLEPLTTRSDDVVRVAQQGLAVALCAGIALTLTPLRMGGMMTDGLGILMSPWLPVEFFRRSIATPYLLRAESALSPAAALTFLEQGLAEHPDSAALHLAAARASAAAGLPKHMRRHLDAATMLAAHDAVVAAELVATRIDLAVETGAPALVAPALADIEQILAGAPVEQRELRGKRAVLLLESGALDAAIAELEQLLATAEDPFERDRCAAYLVLAHTRRGDRAAAQRYASVLDQRRRLDPAVDALARAILGLQPNDRYRTLNRQ